MWVAREAAALGPFLEGNTFDSVWSSDLDRTVTTARLAWGEPTPEPRLREVDFGVWEGRDYDDVDPTVAAVFLEFRDFDIARGESHRDFRRRVRSFVDELAPGRHLLFVHGGVIRVLTQDLGLDRFVATCTVVVVDWTNGHILSVRESGVPPSFNLDRG